MKTHATWSTHSVSAAAVPIGRGGNGAQGAMMVDAPRVGVGILIAREGRLLLLRRKNVHGEGSWSTPGGHLEYGETPEACAAREALEETGVVVGDLRFRAITNDLFEPLGRHYVTIWMEGTWLSGEPAVCAPYEMSEVGWFPWDALPEPLFLPLRNLLQGNCYPPPH